jgi:hypothetical protein
MMPAEVWGSPGMRASSSCGGRKLLYASRGNSHAHMNVGYSCMPGCSHVMQVAKEGW